MIRISDSLTKKMITLVICGAEIAVTIFVIIYFAGNEYANYYFYTSKFIYKAEEPEIKKFQKFILANEIKSDDYDQIMDWVEKQNINYISISKEGEAVLGISNTGEFTLLGNAQRNLDRTWPYLYQVEFADGLADVFIYNGYAEKYYFIIAMIAALIAILFYILAVFCGIRKSVQYLVLIKKEIFEMQETDYQCEITVKGQDEICDLAEQLNRMRETILCARKKEQELKMSQDNLLLGMAHDVRTPLTSQMAYLEILRSSKQIAAKEKTYLEKAYVKAVEIKELSEQLFEYFFTSTASEIHMDEPCEVKFAIGEYLSEMVYLLEYSGFGVDTSDLLWNPVLVSLNSEYVGRIINNLYSNIAKYAKPRSIVKVWIDYFDKEIVLHISNEINSDPQVTSKTGIGMKNVAEMMRQMGGNAENQNDNERYNVTLTFPKVTAT